MKKKKATNTKKIKTFKKEVAAETTLLVRGISRALTEVGLSVTSYNVRSVAEILYEFMKYCPPSAPMQYLAAAQCLKKELAAKRKRGIKIKKAIAKKIKLAPKKQKKK